MPTPMTSEELRQVQGPPKERYRRDPGAVLITLEAERTLDEGITCSVQTGKALVRVGLHLGTGGERGLACIVFQTLAGSPSFSVSLERA